MRTQIVRSLVTAAFASLICAGLVSPTRADAGNARAPADRAVWSEIAENVRRRASSDLKLPEPASVSPSPAAVPDELEGEDVEIPPDSPLAHIAPAREAITVPAAPPLAPTAGKVQPEIAVGYRSNTWRQGGKRLGAGLSFSSGVLAPSSGLDPALQAQALTTRGRPFVYGFVLLTVPRDEALEQRLAGLGVQLLGPHDDYHKARMPVGSLAPLASMREVAWVGVSAPKQKLSTELTALRGPEGRKLGVGPDAPLPIVINLFEGDESGAFRRELEALGATVADYDPELDSYRAVATGPTIDAIAALDFVLFVEVIGMTSPGHDQSTPLVDADIIRPGLTPLGHTRFGAWSVMLGVMDTGFEMGAGGHQDLNTKHGCGINFTTDPAGAFEDEHGHGTHVLGTIAGRGAANPMYRGVATSMGNVDHIRVAKIWNKTNWGQDDWMANGMDYMSHPSECGSAPPEVINISGGGSGIALTGTDALSRKLDQKVWTYGQAYVVCSGNIGENNPSASSIWRPGVAKNALTVGNVFDSGRRQAGDLFDTSSRGPTGDGRMKPNLVAPGTAITSAKAGTTNEYRTDFGCSMATPHVSGLAATLMDHYPDFRGRPALLRAHMMATAIPHDDRIDTDDDNLYGLGRASGYLAHWDHTNNDGWSTYSFRGFVNSQGYQYEHITVPPGAQRLIVVLTWDEPAASAGASRAVTYDVDLYVDRDADCGFVGNCGEYASISRVDNVEYVIIENPPAGTYRLKVHPVNAPAFNLPYGMVARIIRGDTKPTMTATLEAPPTAGVGTAVRATLHVSTPAYVVSGVVAEVMPDPSGVLFLSLETRRHDGIDMGTIEAKAQYTLGNLVPLLGRSATLTYVMYTPGSKTLAVRLWSENGGEFTVTAPVEVIAPPANLVQTDVTMSPSTPIRSPGSGLSVTDTVQNFGDGPSRASTTRYYLSLDAAKSTNDKRLSGQRSVPPLAPGAVHTGTANLTIPSTTQLGTYFLLACGDDRSDVEETDETNNCLIAPGTVTVTRSDLVTTAISSPPATIARGGAFAVTDTAQNIGPVASGPSKIRYYLSLDGVKGSGDRLLSATRTVAGLAPGATSSGTADFAQQLGQPPEFSGSPSGCTKTTRPACR